MASVGPNMVEAMMDSMMLQKEAPLGRLADQFDFVAGVQNLLAEALDDYLIGTLLGEEPRRPGPWEMAALHSRWVADWNTMVFRSTTGAVGALAAAQGDDHERVSAA